MLKKVTILFMIMMAAFALAGDLEVDNLSVQQDAAFYGAVRAYVPGGDVSMGSFTNQSGGGSGTNSLAPMPGINPVGSIQMFAATNAPSGWLVCNGAAVSRTTYSNLFAVIGVTYGAGNTSTTFNLPNFKHRFPLCETNGLGVVGGYENVTLSLDQIPSHDHWSFSDGNIALTWTQIGTGAGGVITGYAPATPKRTGFTGGGQSHSNMPPFVAVNFIIYAGQ